jgi:hypothetical protein
MLTLAVCSVSVVTEDLVPQYALAAPRKPRMQAFDRLLHIQARVQAQVLGSRLRSMHGLILRTASGCGHEQAVFVHTRRTEPRAAHSGRLEERTLVHK